MILVIGGAFQGKGRFVKNTLGVSAAEMLEAEDTFSVNLFPSMAEVAVGKKAVHNLQSWVRLGLKLGNTTADLGNELFTLCEKNPDIIITCDEVGCGVVPMDRFERLYREECGRLLCDLAEKAESVYRIYCGIPTKIK